MKPNIKILQSVILMVMLTISGAGCSSRDTTSVPTEPEIPSITPTGLEQPTATLISTKTCIPPTLTITPTNEPTQGVGVAFDPNEPDPWLPELITPIEVGKEYILWRGREAAEPNSLILFATEPNSEVTIMVVRGAELRMSGWSPSQQYYLLANGPSVYLADKTISEVKKIFQGPEDVNFGFSWLTDEILLGEFYKDIALPPDRYIFNLKTGELYAMMPEGDYFVQNIFPEEENWVEVDWASGRVYLMSLDSEPKEILNDYKVTINPYLSGSIFLKPDTNEIIFRGIKSTDRGRYFFLRTSLDTGETQILEVPVEDTNIDDYELSPDGRYLGYIQEAESMETFYFRFYDFQSETVSQTWEIPNVMSIAQIVWSPDSHSIATYYGSSYGAIPGLGIQVLDLDTGEIHILISSDSFQELGLFDLADIDEWVIIRP